MPKTLEGLIVKDIMDELNVIPRCWVYKTHGDPYTRRGLPDIVGLIDGYYIALEVKQPGKEHTLTALQGNCLDTIKKNGGIAAMVTTVEQARKVVLGGYLRKKNRRSSEDED